MSLPPLHGHVAAKARLASAIRRGTLQQLLLITGPAGVGRQRLALWASQFLFCESPGQDEPCGECRPCHLVGRLAHPDLHWLVPVPRPKSGDPDKQVEELAEAQAEVLEERRNQPLYGPPDGLAGHFVATARLIARRAALKPVEGQHRVFLVGVAERLVPQESSQEAANALLKLFEEPPAGTHFILTAEDAESVLPTIRSRAVRLRLGRLRDDEVREVLGGQAPVADLEDKVRRAEGVPGRVLGGDDAGVKAERAAAALLEAAMGRSGPVWQAALRQQPFSARGDFTRTLDAMAELVNRAARAALGAGGQADTDGRLAALPPERLVAALGRIGEAREQAQGNVNPQLLLAVLGQDLAEVL